MPLTDGHAKTEHTRPLCTHPLEELRMALDENPSPTMTNFEPPRVGRGEAVVAANLKEGAIGLCTKQLEQHLLLALGMGASLIDWSGHAAWFEMTGISCRAL